MKTQFISASNFIILDCDNGKMNNKSDDETYMCLISNLRDKLKQLAKKIEQKVYEYEFLKE